MGGYGTNLNRAQKGGGQVYASTPHSYDCFRGSYLEGVQYCAKNETQETEKHAQSCLSGSPRFSLEGLPSKRRIDYPP